MIKKLFYTISAAAIFIPMVLFAGFAQARFTDPAGEASSATLETATTTAATPTQEALQASTSAGISPDSLFRSIRDALAIQLPKITINMISGPVSDMVKREVTSASDLLRKRALESIFNLIHRTNERIRNWVGELYKDFAPSK